MESNFTVCPKCFNALGKVGIAQEVYAVIASGYIDSGLACQLSEDSGITKFLEKKGYITTHEFDNILYAKPYIKTCEHTHILCRNTHTKTIAK
jgi:hypothetical protein